MSGFPLHSEIKEGDTVKILKQNTSDVFVVGVIDKKISSKDHVRGCFVHLKDNSKGRVHELISHNLSTVFTVEPEDGILEYK